MTEAAPADLVLRGGKIITIDPAFRIAQAVAIQDGRFVALGRNDEIAPLIGPRTAIEELQGRAVIPGLIDGHAHLDREGLKTLRPSLAGVRSIGDILERIGALARSARPGEWIVTNPIGNPPDYAGLPAGLAEGRYPTRQDLDRVAPDNPVYIRPLWGYWRRVPPLVSVANSRALALAGIDRNTPEPCAAVKFERDGKSGEPTGVFLEWTDMPIVEHTLLHMAPQFTHTERTEALAKSIEIYHSTATTGVFEGHGIATEVMDAYKALHRAGRLKMRADLVFSPSWSSLGDVAMDRMVGSWLGPLAGRGMGDAFLRVSGFYVLLESKEGGGSGIENRLRAQAAPRTGWAGFHYDAMLPRAKLVECLIAAARSGIRAVGIWNDLLDVFAEVDRIVPLAGRRWTLAHIGVLTPQEVERASALGLVFVGHTARNILKMGYKHLQAVGPARENEISPFKTLLQAGVPFALGTDNMPPSMFERLWHCIARIDGPTGRVIAPDQKLSREEALRAATMGGAYLCQDEDQRGSIEPGKLADFAVLSADPLRCAEAEIKTIVAEATGVGGEIVYRRRGPR